MENNTPTTIDEYISSCPEEIQPLLHKMRATICAAAPEAVEKISWGMATFTYHGNLVHFSCEKKHIGFHPAPSAIEQFRDRLTDYSCSKGTIRFPFEKPIPWEVITEIVQFRVKEQERLAAEKQMGVKQTRELRPRYPMPDDIADAMEKEGVRAQYDLRPPYQRNDYIGWITRAKRPETRQKRLRQMLDELAVGNVYMGMAYTPKKR